MKKLLLMPLAALGMLCAVGTVHAQNISTFAGGYSLAPGIALNTGIGGPNGVIKDAAGNLYLADYNNAAVRKVTPAGVITTVAGIGTQGYSGDGGPATAAQLYTPNGITLDAAGNIFVADYGNNRIRRIDAVTGIITTIASNLNAPIGVAADTAGNVYFAEESGHRIRKIAASNGLISTVAGTGVPGFSGDGGLATAAQIASPQALALDAAGNIYIADLFNRRIRKVNAITGFISTIAGTGTSGYSGDGGLATAAQISYVSGIAVDANNNIYLSDDGAQRVRKINGSTGIITTVAGTGTAGATGDGGLATVAQLNVPKGITADAAGNLYFADNFNYKVRMVNGSSGIITTVVGTGFVTYGGDGGLATNAKISIPRAVTADAAGNVYISEGYNFRIRKVNTSGIISTFAGNGAQGSSGDGGLATAAQLNSMLGNTAVDPWGNIYITDCYNQRIRKVDTAGIITTIAGTGIAGFSGDSGLAINAKLAFPQTIAFSPDYSKLYIAENGNHVIRQVVLGTGVITTICGTGGLSGSTGDGGPAKSAKLNAPWGLAVDTSGDIYISENGDARIRKISIATGIITTIAGSSDGFSGDGGLATSAEISSPRGIVFDNNNNLYIADAGNNRIRKINAANGVITTIAGNGAGAFSGDGGLPTAASFYIPSGLAIDGSGRMYVADQNSSRIRSFLISLAPTIHISASLNNTCPGSVITFTATSTMGGANPSYQWTVNGNAVSGATNTSYSYIPQNGDVVRCTLTSSASNAVPSTVTSDFITMNILASVIPTVQITASQNNLCTGIPVTYTAAATNGGSNPVYQWLINGNAVAGVSGSTYSYTPANHDTISCVLVSNATCAGVATVLSNNIVMTLIPPVSPAVSIVPSMNNICLGTPVTYTAIPVNGGALPAYRWFVNGTAATGFTPGNMFNYTPVNGTKIYCILHADSAACLTTTFVTSDTVEMIAYPVVTPSAFIVANPGTNVSTGELITFSATVTNGGSNPQYQWQKNGTNIPGATQSNYFALAGTDVVNNDEISFRVQNTDNCGLPATSNRAVIAIATGIEQTGNSIYPLTLYPNPNKGSFTIKGTLQNRKSHEVKLEVYNTVGQMIHQETLSVTNGILEQQVSLPANLPSGNYYLKLNDGNNAVMRFVVSESK